MASPAKKVDVPKEMKALVFVEKGKIQIVKKPVPEPQQVSHRSLHFATHSPCLCLSASHWCSHARCVHL